MPDPSTATARTQRPRELSKDRLPVSSMTGLYATRTGAPVCTGSKTGIGGLRDGYGQAMVVPQPTDPVTPAVPEAPVSPAVPDPGTPADPEEPATVPGPEEPATPAVPEPGPGEDPEPSPGEAPGGE